jgi:hypothetical protein
MLSAKGVAMSASATSTTSTVTSAMPCTPARAARRALTARPSGCAQAQHASSRACAARGRPR